jgi:hypothetical protein
MKTTSSPPSNYSFESAWVAARRKYRKPFQYVTVYILGGRLQFLPDDTAARYGAKGYVTTINADHPFNQASYDTGTECLRAHGVGPTVGVLEGRRGKPSGASPGPG